MISGCVFCEIIAGARRAPFVWEDKDHFAFLDQKPVEPGHTLLVPKRHVETVFDLPEDVYSKLFLRAKMLARPLQAITKATHIGFSVEGFGVGHAHIHLIPLFHGAELLPRRTMNANEVELEEIAKRLREGIHGAA